MTNDNTLRFLNRISESAAISAKNKLQVQINDVTLTTGNGATESFFTNIYDSYVGIKELYSNPDMKTDRYTFMKAFISVLHETTHIYQCEHLLYADNDSSRFIALSCMAESCSPAYYYQNYKLMPHEIAAQYSAIKNGYEILCQYVDEQKANELICDYVNRHIADEFIKKPDIPYVDVNDILDDYDEAFKHSRTHKRVIDINYYENGAKSDVDYNDADMIVQVVMKHGIAPLKTIDNMKTGIEQDFMLAKRFIHVCEKRFGIDRNDYPALANIDFDSKFFTTKAKLKTIRDIELESITPSLSEISDTSDDFFLDGL